MPPYSPGGVPEPSGPAPSGKPGPAPGVAPDPTYPPKRAP